MKLKKYSIKKRFLLIFFLLVVLPTAVFIGFFTHSYYGHALSQVIEERYSLLRQIDKNIESRLTNYGNTSLMFYHNDQIEKYIEAGDFKQSSPDVDFYLSSLVNTEKNVISSMLLLGTEPKNLAGARLVNSEDYFARYIPPVMKLKGKTAFIPTCQFATSFQPDVRVFALARAINGRKGPVGSLWIFISASFFDDILQDPGLSTDSTMTYILDGNRVMASNNIDLAGTVLDAPWLSYALKTREGHFYFDGKGESSVITVTTVESAGWNIVTVTPRQEILRNTRYILIMAAVVFGLYALFVLVMCLMLSKMLFHPIARLSHGLQKVSEGDFGYLLPKTSKDEIGNLTDSYNDMTKKIQSLVESVKLREQEKNKETIKVLSMQIGSHFLYNTLNTIKWMAVMNRQPQIKEVVNSLIMLLMSVTHHNNEEISLREELNLVHHYGVIQKVRYANFEIVFDVPEELLDFRVCKMILQPVVENCILHGFFGRAEMGTIVISARMEKNVMYLVVSDNGRGFDSSTLQRKDVVPEKQDYVGLHNIDQRLRLNYGEEYGVEIDSRPGERTTVTLRLPVIQDEKKEENG